MSTENQTVLDHIIQIATDQTLIADGPLSQQCAKALHEQYGKERDEKTGLVLESQANDTLALAGVWQASQALRQQLTDQGHVVGLLYGVKKAEAGLSDVVKIAEAVSTMSPEQKTQSMIYVDTAVHEETGQETSDFWCASLEALAQQHQLRWITSLEQVTHARRD